MSADPRIEEIYSIETNISSDVLAEVSAVRAELDKFDYGQLYAYAQVNDDDLQRRAETAVRFAEKIAQKQLDNETIRTILESQQIVLPQSELLLVRGGSIADKVFFERYHARMQYLVGKNIQTVFDSGLDNGRPYVVAEIVNTMADWDGIVSFKNDVKLNIAHDIGRALKFLHTSEIPHGALRPEMVAFSGFDHNASVCSWALVPVLDAALENGGGAEMKSLFAFAAPEVLSGSEPDLSSDIYSFGALLYYLFCGVKPWRDAGTLFTVLEQMQEGVAPFTDQEMSVLPEGVAAVIRMATMDARGDRYATVGAMLADIESCINGQEPEALKRLKNTDDDSDLPPAAEKKITDPEKVKEALSALAAAADEAIENKESAEPTASPAEVAAAGEREGVVSEPVAVAAAPQVSGEVVASVAPAQAVSSEMQQPLFNEPQLPDVGSMTAGIEKSGNSNLIMAGVAALVIVAGIALGYYFLGGDDEVGAAVAQNNTSVETKSDATDAGSKVTPPQVESSAVAAQPDERKTQPQVEKPVQSQALASVSYKALLASGRQALAAGDYQQAVNDLEIAVAKNNSTEATALLAQAKEKLAANENVQKREAALALAQRMLKVRDLEAAEASVLEVLNLPDNSADQDALAILKKVRDEKFAQAITKAERELAEGKLQQADVSFSWAMSIKGHENSQRAVDGQKKARAALEQEKAEALKKQQEEFQRKSQYEAAMAEAARKREQKRWEEAAAAYNLALSIEGYKEDEAAKAALFELKSIAAQEKEREAEKLEARRKLEFEGQIKIGEALLAAGKYTDAEAVFARALKIEGYAASTIAEDGRQRSIAASVTEKNLLRYDSMLREGFSQLKSEEFKKAETTFRDCLKIKGFEKGEIARQGIMLAEIMQRGGNKRNEYVNHIKAGDALYRAADFDKAALEYGRAIVSAPGRPEGYIRRGQAYLDAGEYEKALENFKLVLAKNPENVQAQAGEISVYAAMNKFAEVEEALTTVLAAPVAPERKAWAESGLGWLYFSSSMWGGGKRGVRADNNRAVELFKLAANGGSAAAVNNLGVAYESGKGINRDYAKAREMFEQAAKSGLPAAMFNLGLLYFEGRAGGRDYNKALEYFEQAAKAGMPRANGRLAEMYSRGRGVERDTAKAQQYAAKNSGRTDRDNSYELAGPAGVKIVFADIEKSFPLISEKEISEQYGAIIAEAKKLLYAKKYASAARIAGLADFLDGHTNDKEAAVVVEQATAGRKSLGNHVELVVTEVNKAQQAEADRVSRSDEVVAVEAQTKAPDLSNLPKAPDVKETVAVKPLISSAPKVTVAGLADDEFKAEYDKLLAEAGRLVRGKNFGLAQQAYALALALPGKLDDGAARSGLEAAKKSKSDAGARTSDYEAVLDRASGYLREGQWPQALYLFQDAKKVAGSDTILIADIGISVADKSSAVGQIKEPEAAPIKTGDTRDMASYQTAMKQAQEFLAQQKYQAAEQMADIVLSMKGFEGDKAALLLKNTARIGRMQIESTPEAIAMKRQKHKAAYEQLILTGKVHVKNGDKAKAQKAFLLVFKLPGYEDDAETKKLLEGLEGAGVSADIATTPALEVSPEQRAQYLALMQQADAALLDKNWIKAEELYRIVLQMAVFSNDAKARNGLTKALEAQGKDTDVLPPVATVAPKVKSSPGSENLDLTEGFITDADDIAALKHKAEFAALMREARRQYELGQFEVAEAILNEALKVKGFENNAEALALSNEAKANKPKAAEIKVPDHPDDHAEVDPRQEMKKQADLLLNDGNRLRAQGKLKAALQAYASGIDLDRENPQLLINRGDTYAALGQFELSLADYNKALKMTSLGGDQQAYAWNNIANVYYYGKKDLQTAVDYYLKAAQGGSAAAMNSLGVCYGFGRGVSKDPSKALEWYKSAAALNYGNAMLNLGLVYQNGWGITVDNQKAFEWYLKATERNVPRAFVRVALMYKEGLGVQKDEGKAAEYSAKALELGYKRDR